MNRVSFVVRTVLATTLLALTCADAEAQLPAGVHERTVMLDGNERIYDIYVPASYTGSTAVPIVLDFHGFLTNPQFQRDFSGWPAIAEAEGFILVEPLGLFGQPGNPTSTNSPMGPSWNAGDICCGQAVVDEIDDVGFARALVSLVADEANIDLRRVYATGLSNGAALSQRIGCDAADAFAAVVPIAFPIGFDPLDQCTPSRPIPVLAFAGTTDAIVPYLGGAFIYGPDVPSARQSFNYWRTRNGCGPPPADQTTVTGEVSCEIHDTCDAGVEVGLCSMVGSVSGIGHILYLNDDIDVAQEAWDFLSRFTLPSLCLASPIDGCRTAGKASLTVKVGDKAEKNSLVWAWKKGQETALAALGDPTDDTEYALCVYDRQAEVALLESTVSVPAGADWKAAGTKGFKFKNSDGSGNGAKSVQLTSGGAGKAKAIVKAGGLSFAAPNAFDSAALFAESTGAIVQLVNENGECWTSALTSSKKNTANIFKAKTP